MAIVVHALRQRRMSAPIFQMTGLTGARIEQRAQPVGSIGRGRRRDPILAEDGVADLKIELALDVEIAGGAGEGIRRVVAAARGGIAAGLVLAGLKLGKIDRRRAGAMDFKNANKQRKCESERNRARK